MRSVWVICHANQVQYLEPQEDHTFLSPLSPYPFNFRYRCFWLDQCILTLGTFSRSLAHSSGDNLYITRLASNKIFSPSNKMHQEVGRAKDLSAPLYLLGAAALGTSLSVSGIANSYPIPIIMAMYMGGCRDLWQNEHPVIVTLCTPFLTC